MAPTSAPGFLRPPTINSTGKTDADLIAQWGHPPGDGDVRYDIATDTFLIYRAGALKRIAAAASVIAPDRAVYNLARERGGTLAGATSAATRYLLRDGATAVSASAATVGRCPFRLESGLWTPPAGMSIKLNLRARMQTNATAPAATFTIKLSPVDSAAGASGTNSINPGTTVPGSSFTIATPAALAGDVSGSSGDFAMPADGSYVIGFANDVTTAAGADVTIGAALFWRWV